MNKIFYIVKHKSCKLKYIFRKFDEVIWGQTDKINKGNLINNHCYHFLQGNIYNRIIKG